MTGTKKNSLHTGGRKDDSSASCTIIPGLGKPFFYTLTNGLLVDIIFLYTCANQNAWIQIKIYLLTQYAAGRTGKPWEYCPESQDFRTQANHSLRMHRKVEKREKRKEEKKSGSGGAVGCACGGAVPDSGTVLSICGGNVGYPGGNLPAAGGRCRGGYPHVCGTAYIQRLLRCLLRRQPAGCGDHDARRRV